MSAPTFVFGVCRQQVEQQEGRLGPQPLVFRLHASHQHREAVLRDKRLEPGLLLSDQTCCGGGEAV